MLTLREVATIFHVSRQTLYNWIAEGRLSVVKIGKLVRVEETEVDRIRRGDDNAAKKADNENNPL